MTPHHALILACISTSIGGPALGTALSMLKGYYGPNRLTDALLWTALGASTVAALSVMAYSEIGLALYLAVFAAIAGATLAVSPPLARRRARHAGMLDSTDGMTVESAIEDMRARIQHQGLKPRDAAKQLADQLRKTPAQAEVLLAYNPDERLPAR